VGSLPLHMTEHSTAQHGGWCMAAEVMHWGWQ
jgi:hypothetical protein